MTRRKPPSIAPQPSAHLHDGDDQLVVGREVSGRVGTPRWAPLLPSGLPRPGGLRDVPTIDTEPLFWGQHNVDQLRQVADRELPGRVRDLGDHEVRVLIGRHVDDGRMQARQLPPAARRPVSYDEVLEPDTPFDPPGDDDVELAWLEIDLQTSDGEPYPNERYHVVFSDGSEQEGQLDDRGHARFDDIPRGVARVSFPDVDRGDWRLVAGPGDEEDDTLYRVRLVDPDGKALGRVPMVFATSAGDIEAFSGADGRAEVEDAESTEIDVHVSGDAAPA